MDYTALNTTIVPKVIEAVRLINNPEILPAVRQLNQEILFREVGNAIYTQVYDMNAFDFDISHTRGPGMDDRYFGIAKIASDSVSTGSLGLDERINTFLNQVVAQAQYDATTTARQSGKYTKVTRNTRGKTCAWCRSLAGVYTNPDSDVFRRHRGCDCTIFTEGYKSRNGLLNNYVKPKDR